MVLSYDGLKMARDCCCTLDTLDIRAIPIYAIHDRFPSTLRTIIDKSITSKANKLTSVWFLRPCSNLNHYCASRMYPLSYYALIHTVLCTENFAKHEVNLRKVFAKLYTNLQEVFMKVHEDFTKFSVHSTLHEVTTPRYVYAHTSVASGGSSTVDTYR